MSDAALYAARVVHRRRIAPLYRFVYRVFYVLVDVDRVDALASRLRWFSRNRFNLFALHDRDYADASCAGLRAFAEGEAGFACGRIRLLTMPRVLGFAFNPLSLWYCEDRSGALRAVIADVRNTFGERHCYRLEPAAFNAPIEKEKCFHVSPFFDLVGRYRFDLAEPGEKLRVAIHETREGAPILDAMLSGERRALTDGEILRQVLWMPWMTLKVVAAIHWEALKLWLRGARFHRKPAPPAQQTT
jgi:DUF1365 family protein